MASLDRIVTSDNFVQAVMLSFLDEKSKSTHRLVFKGGGQEDGPTRRAHDAAGGTEPLVLQDGAEGPSSVAGDLPAESAGEPASEGERGLPGTNLYCLLSSLNECQSRQGAFDR